MTAPITAAGRPLRLKCNLGEDALLVQTLAGEERMSAPYHYRLELLSENASINGHDLIGTPAVLHIEILGEGERVIHGLFNRFVAIGRDVTGLAAYRAEVVPWLWFYSLSTDFKIFQDMTVPEIVEDVAGKPPNAKYQTKFENKCIGTYPKREYCVQYNETLLDFVSRLMEEEGIFYFFEHDANGHTMVIADSPSSVHPCPVMHTLPAAQGTRDGAPEANVLTHLEIENSAVTGAHAGDDWDPIAFTSYFDGTGTDGTGRRKYFPQKAKDKDDQYRYANLRAAAQDCLRVQIRGRTTCPSLQSGKKFTLTDHARSDANAEYQLVAVRHSAHAPFLRSGAGAGGFTSGRYDYTNEFVALPSSMTYRPPLVTPKAVVHGSQTALVVGKEGEEIWTDKYGRVKVFFHTWDGYQHDKTEDSSCWVRVSSAWAGSGFGWVQIPRIGDEVIVDFLEGDPDRPIITGRVYNGDHVQPWPLPDDQTRSGLRTRSSKDGSDQNYNELSFEDKKGSEEVFLHAERLLKTEVEADELRTVGHDRTTTIENNDAKTVKKGNDTTTVEKGDQTVEIQQGNRDVKVYGTQNHIIQTGHDNVRVMQGDQNIEVSQGDRSITIGQGNLITVLDMGTQHTVIKMGNQTVQLDMGDQTTKLNLGSISQEAMQGIELKVGESSIKIDQLGVTIKGMMIQIEGQIQTEVKGLMTQVSGDAMLTAKGGITMIN